MREGSPTRSAIWFYATAAIVLVADQVTKLLARGLLEPDMPITVIPGFFDLRLMSNQGGAFGVGAVPRWVPLFIIVALAAIYAIVRLRRASGASRGLSFGLGLLLGGATGNLIDRLTSPDHSVTDFLSFHIRYGGKQYTWPTFNIADAAIVVGAAMVLFIVYAIEKPRAGDEGSTT